MKTTTNISSDYPEEVIKITDVTLREWDQAPLTSFNREEKSLIALMLDTLWVDTIEAWFAASEAEKENWNITWAIKAIWNESSTVISSLWLCNKSSTIDSLEVLNNYNNPRVHVFIATPDNHINKKFENFWDTLEERREKVIEKMVEQIQILNDYKINFNSNLEIEVSAEAATDNAINEVKILDFESEEFKFLVRWVREVITAWANIINIPDTLWNLLPWESEELFAKLVLETDNLKEKYTFDFSCHIHNDIASATTWALAAIRGWARQIELTILWIWERTWNTPLHEIIWIINEKPFSIIKGKKVVLPKIETELIWPISRFVEKILNYNWSLREPFIWALSDVDWSWVHNADEDLYGWSKEKLKYWWEEHEPFFSPRWWRNQIYKILKKYWVKDENPKSELISKVTTKSCIKAETTKALYYSNIYAMYLEEKGVFKINSIEFEWKTVNVNFTLFWEEINILWHGEEKQWFIDWIVAGLNEFLWDSIVDIDDIKIVTKPGLRQSIEKFYEDVSETTFKITEKFRSKVDDIIWINWSWKYSKQMWVSHVKMVSSGKHLTSVETWSDVTENNIKAIIYWALPEIVKKLLK